MTIEFTCLYCNHTWIKMIYSEVVVKAQICPLCKDHSLKVRNKDQSSINYYKGGEARLKLVKPEDEENDGGPGPEDWDYLTGEMD